jgi:AcrR family transcriptional regulator
MSMTDRRAPQRGDRRRAALLRSLQSQLEKADLESINVADIASSAGVTRSAFYFYFENKAIAVAALTQQMYAEAFAATDVLIGDGPPAERIEGTIRGLFDAWDRHQNLYRAMLQARASNQAVRDMWETDRQSFEGPVAGMIREERDAGRAPDGPDPDVLASVLLELNDRMLERLALGGPHARESQVAAVVAIWLRTIYGRTDES